MKTYILILVFILFYTGSYAQKSTESYQDSLVIRILQRVLEHPHYPIDSVGIIVFQFEKNNDSLELQLLYSSLNQYKLPNDYSIRLYPRSISVRSIPDGYKRIVRVDFYFGSDYGKWTLPSEEIMLLAIKKMQAYKGKIKELPSITMIGYKPSCIKMVLPGLAPLPKMIFPSSLQGITSNQ